MSNDHPSDILRRFVRFVESQLASEAPTVKDLLVTVRNERLSEYSSWPFHDLDKVQEELARYRNDTVLANLVSY